MDHHESNHQRWLHWHARFGMLLRERPITAEPEPDPGPGGVSERLIQCAWYDQLLRGDSLVTASGKKLRVLEPGSWNTGPGPDFRDALIELSGRQIRGDVEIHLNTRDWHHHGHDRDFEFNTVVLHASLHAGDDRPHDEKQNGERLERLVLQPVLDPDLETMQRTIQVDDYPYGRPEGLGVCHNRLAALPSDDLLDLLTAAGRARIEDKIARLDAMGRMADDRQLFYQCLLLTNGLRSSKTLYFLLGKRAPAAELIEFARDVPPAERVDMILSILLHVAQLMPLQGDLFDGLEGEDLAFARRLQHHWQTARPYFADRLMPPTRRWFSGVRPAGFPPRRLTAVAMLLAAELEPGGSIPTRAALHMDRLAKLPGTGRDWKACLKDFVSLINVEGGGHYFQRHFTLGGKPCKPQALLGEAAARSFAFNSVIPLLILNARRRSDKAAEEAAWSVLARFPVLPSNSVTDFMRWRLFGETGIDKGLIRGELLQQSLYKVFHDCCSLNERSCSQCTFLNAPFLPLGA